MGAYVTSSAGRPILVAPRTLCRKAGHILLRRKLLIATGALALAVPTIAYAETGVDRFDEAPSKAALDSKIRPASLDRDAKVTVMVELTGDPVAVVEGKAGATLSPAEVSQVRSGLKKCPGPGQAPDPGPRRQGAFADAVGLQRHPGLDPRGRRSTRSPQLPNVVAVHAVKTYTIDNAVSVPFLGVPQVWQNTGYTGENVKVAIIDTGIDYTHANFGGPGTVEAYEARRRRGQPADPAQFGPTAPRIKGGYDFVGDDYDADDRPATAMPQPDPNPLDCNGHGSHVAGTAGGQRRHGRRHHLHRSVRRLDPVEDVRHRPGRRAAGRPVRARVFGCEGSTDVVVARHRLGRRQRHGRHQHVARLAVRPRQTTPTRSPRRTRIGAGVVVVTSAGNSGPSPYITGRRHRRRRDLGRRRRQHGDLPRREHHRRRQSRSRPSTPTARTCPAVPAHDRRALTDDPATPPRTRPSAARSAPTPTRDRARSGGNQLAVSTRGTCARVAKAIFAQQAGAAAVIMVNNDRPLPAVRGPDHVEPRHRRGLHGHDPVPRRPQLGRSGAAAADGQPLDARCRACSHNPGFSGYASFSSSGPRSGDSAPEAVDVALRASRSFDRRRHRQRCGRALGNVDGLTARRRRRGARPSGAPGLEGEPGRAPRWSAPPIRRRWPVTGCTLGGGLVDTRQVVNTRVFAYGDQYNTAAGKVSEATLSFGFHESQRHLHRCQEADPGQQGQLAGRSSCCPTRRPARPVREPELQQARS